MQVIPLSPDPNQTLKAQIGGNNCQLNIYQLSTGLFCDVYMNGNALVTGRICRDRVTLLYPYMGFPGNLMFVDQQAKDDPTYDGLGSRYQLMYISS